MLTRAKSDKISHRTAAMLIAVEKGRNAMNLLGLYRDRSEAIGAATDKSEACKLAAV